MSKELMFEPREVSFFTRNYKDCLEVLIDKLVDLILCANTRRWTPSVFERPLFERGARNPYLRKADATLLV